MYLLETTYPFVLASVNMAMGWLLYYLSESVAGVLLVVIGLLVVLTLLGQAISEHRPITRNSA
jgi:uncharacterized membrane protein